MWVTAGDELYHNTQGALYNSDRSQLLVNAPTDAGRHEVTREAKASAPRPTAPFHLENVGPAQTDPGSLEMQSPQSSTSADGAGAWHHVTA